MAKKKGKGKVAPPAWEYQFFGTTGNEPDFTQVNALAAQGWELVFFNGDVPDSGGQRQWIYVMGIYQ